MAGKQRAAAKTVAQAEETRKRVHAALDNANGAPAKRGPGRPPKGTPCLAQMVHEGEAAHQEHQRLTAQREQVPQRIRAMGHAYHCVAVERGGRRQGKRIAGDIDAQIDTIRTIAPQEHLSHAGVDRIEKAARVVPKMRATVACVSGYVRQQGRPLDWTPPASYAMPAHLMPSSSLDRVASTRTVPQGAPLRTLAERLRTPLCAPAGACGTLSPGEQETRKRRAAQLAEVFQHSSANVAGRNGDLALRNHQRRGLDHPRKPACLTAVHNFFLTRPDGTTAARHGLDPKGIGWPTR